MEDYDAWIIVGTGLDDEGIDKDLRKLKTKLKNEEEKLELKISAKEDAEADLQKLLTNIEKVKEENEKNLQVLKETEDELKRLEDKASAGSLNLGEASKLGRLENEIVDLQENYNKSNAELERQNSLLDGAYNKVSKTTFEYGEQVRKVAELRIELEEAENSQRKFGSNLLKTTQKIITKVGKWALAIFGIRSAYMAIRQAMSVLSQYDETLKADLQYIRFAIATALEPIVKKIVEWAYKLLGFINAISIKLFNYNLFLNASVDNFKKLNNQANKLQKTLAGFDEMNIIGNTATDYTPGMDMSQATKDATKWLNKIEKKIKSFANDTIKAIFDPKMFDTQLGNWNYFMRGIGETILGLETSFKGLGKQVEGTWKFIKGIFTGNIEEISAGFGEFIEGLAETIFKGIPMIFQGLLDIISGLIEGVTSTLLRLLDKFILQPIIKFIDENLIQPIKNKLSSSKISEWMDKNIINPIKTSFNKLPNWLKSTVKGVLDVIIGFLNMFIDGLNAMLIPFRIVILAMGKLMRKNWTLENVTIPHIPLLAKGGIINLPNRGVDLGVAKGGESGHEGVIPLTDSQQMALLGAEIGKHVIVNLTNINQMNGRQLNRELKKIASEDAFAGNYEVI